MNNYCLYFHPVRSTIIIFLCVLPCFGNAQDFTRQNGEEANEKTEALLLIAPVHPHYLLSELDRKMSPDGNVDQNREKLRKAWNRRLTEAFSDSLETFDLLMDDLEKVNRLEFLYNGLDLSYQSVITDEPDKKKLQWPKKKEEKSYQGAEVKVESGQLRRDEILEKQYMGVAHIDEVMLDYMKSQQPFTHLLITTQIELRRNIDPKRAQEEPYLLKAHYCLLNNKGQVITGGFIEKGLSEDEVDTGILTHDIFEQSAQELLTKIDPSFNPPEEVHKEVKEEKVKGVKNEDY
jgi:hypothetical protein